MDQNLKNSLWNFKSCADQAPAGCYESAKALENLIKQACSDVMMNLRGMGFKADACDMAFELEAAIYDYAKRSNPESPVFATAEGFGESMTGPERERVLAQAEGNAMLFRHAQANDLGVGQEQ